LKKIYRNEIRIKEKEQGRHEIRVGVNHCIIGEARVGSRAMAALLALLSSLLWGSADYFGGILSKKYKALAVTGTSQIFGLIVGVSAVLITGAYVPPSLAWNGYFVSGAIAGIAGLIGLICLYAGLASGRMGVVAPISSLSAIIPLTIAFIGGERASTFQLIGMAVALTGAFLASGPELKEATARPILLGVAAAISFGISLTFLWRGSESEPLLTMTSMRIASVTVVLLIAIRYRSTGGISRNYIPILIFVGAADFLANLTLGIATTKGLVSIAVVLGSLFPIVTAVLAYFFLKERLLPVQYLGVVAAVSGVATIAIG
jgi:drug/metabolite transporter (DMT)-like permease